MTRKKNEKNSLANVLYANNEKMHPAYVSKHNSNPENQTILLMVPNGEGRHYIKVKNFICIIKKNNFDPRWTLFIEWSSFFSDRK